MKDWKEQKMTSNQPMREERGRNTNLKNSLLPANEKGRPSSAPFALSHGIGLVASHSYAGPKRLKSVRED